MNDDLIDPAILDEEIVEDEEGELDEDGMLKKVPVDDLDEDEEGGGFL